MAGFIFIDAYNPYNYELGNSKWENKNKLHLNIILVFGHYTSEFYSCLDFIESILNHCNLMRSLLSSI